MKGIYIIDYSGGVRKEYGPFSSVMFATVNTCTPKIRDDTVTFECDTEDTTELVTVGCITHRICTEENKAEH